MNLTIRAVIFTLLLVIAPQGQAGIFDFFGSKSPEDQMKEGMNGILNKNKQAVFDKIHPTGTATKVEVHAVEIVWKNNKPSKNLNDILRFGVRYTLYWKGPVTKDGFTKVYDIFDAESNRVVGRKILETNGVTNADAVRGGLDFLDGLLNGK